ncbi:hypothetical protein LBMAG35_15780 [Chlorobiota bacterium]|nr:hypothetical protein LBMAG35_15780 [Chlorobiota bacterium]
MQEQKYFTPEEANRTLPLVRSIVNDILRIGSQLRTRITDLMQTGEDPRKDESCMAFSDTLKELHAELEELGCEYKDWNFNIGLVDFPAIIEGREVLLCWRSDEDAITHYHGFMDGYSGRKPLPFPYLNNDSLLEDVE